MKKNIFRKLQTTQNTNASAGVALLFTVLLTSVLLLVAIGIANVAYNESIFSIESRDSGIAFTAADTGIECGLFLYKEAANGLSTDSCGGLSVTMDGTDPTYTFPLATSNASCAAVSILTAYDPLTQTNGSGSDVAVVASGYNVVEDSGGNCGSPSLASNPRIVTREIRVHFTPGT